jgi:hypothetical protein
VIPAAIAAFMSMIVACCVLAVVAAAGDPR